jgi:hypothetical protein
MNSIGLNKVLAIIKLILKVWKYNIN